MKNYEFIETYMNTKILKRTDEDKKELWIPLDPNNSDYAEYLRYTEWVEKGKNPEDFWTQEGNN